MSITKKVINNNEYMFINRSFGNRSGFVHETELYKNDILIGTNKIQYYNRTWECYQFQSVMRGVVSSLIEEYRDNFIKNWKAERNIKRLTNEKREAMQADFEKMESEYHAELEKLYNLL